jgi:hypothetical protein
MRSRLLRIQVKYPVWKGGVGADWQDSRMLFRLGLRCRLMRIHIPNLAILASWKFPMGFHVS